MLLVDGIDQAPTVSRRNERLTKIDLFAETYESATVLVATKGLTTGEISAHLAEVYGAEMSR